MNNHGNSYKQLAIQYHLSYMNLKQRIDLSLRALNTIDYKIQLEMYYQNGMKSIVDKYEDHKYDEVFQYFITSASNKNQVSEQIISDLKNARNDFSNLMNKFQVELISLHEKKEKTVQKLKNAYQKQVQSYSFYQSITKVFERNIVTIDLINSTQEQRQGHIKMIQDLQKNKDNTFGNYKVAMDKYNQSYSDILPELENYVQQIKELEQQVAETVRQLFQKMALTEISALRNRQYDLEQMTKYLDKVDYTKIFTVFKFHDDIFTPLKADKINTYLTKQVNQFIIKYNLLNNIDQNSPIKQVEEEQQQIIPQEIEEQIIKLIETLQDKNLKNDNLFNSIENSVNQENAIKYLQILCQNIKAPIEVTRTTHQLFVNLIIKIYDNIQKEGEMLYKLQRLSQFIHYFSQGESISCFTSLSQQSIYSKRTDYWEWLIFWQIHQTCDGVSDSDKQLIILQQFQNTVQQMAQLKIPTANLQTFITDLAPYYNIKAQQVDEIKQLLTKFMVAHQMNPKSKQQISSFDLIE